METYLEKICYLVDSVLAQHGLSAKIAGGYVAGEGLLLSLSDTTFVNTQVRLDIQKTLEASQVLATVGVVLVHNYLRRFEPGSFASQVIEGEFEVSPAQPVGTVDVLELIADHQRQLAPLAERAKSP
jgi:hypothetical protein